MFPDNGCAPTLNSGSHEGQNIQPSVLAFAQNTRDEVRLLGGDGSLSGALAARAGAKQTTYVIAIQGDGSTSLNANGCGWKDDGSAYTLNTIDRQSVMCAGDNNRNAVCMSSGQANAEVTEGGLAPTLTLLHEAPIVIDRAAYNQGENAAYPPHIEQTELMDSLVARGPHAVAHRTGSST